jgi:hypothetical protein
VLGVSICSAVIDTYVHGQDRKRDDRLPSNAVCDDAPEDGREASAHHVRRSCSSWDRWETAVSTLYLVSCFHHVEIAEQWSVRREAYTKKTSIESDVFLCFSDAEVPYLCQKLGVDHHR